MIYEIHNDSLLKKFVENKETRKTENYLGKINFALLLFNEKNLQIYWNCFKKEFDKYSEFISYFDVFGETKFLRNKRKNTF